MPELWSRVAKRSRALRRLLRTPVDRQYVFIVTYGRSGSTLLQRLINRMPNAHVSGENYNALHPLYLSYLQIVRAKEQRGRAKARTSRNPWFGSEGVRPRAYARAVGDAFVREVIRPPETARLVGFKEIRYFEAGVDFEGFMDFMSVAFPGAKLVFNLRTGDAIAKSAWWAKQEPSAVLARLRGYDDKMRAYAGQHPDNCLVLDYDEYVASPESLVTLFSFLGVPHDKQMVAEVLADRLNHGRRSSES